MARERQIQSVMGLPALSGPFERLGIDRMVGLGWAYVGLSVVEVLAGILLWQRRRGGAWLSVALIPLPIVFWVGFALPLPPLVAALRLTLLHGDQRRSSIHVHPGGIVPDLLHHEGGGRHALGTARRGGTALMPLESYPFSEPYGWTEDSYGLSWQIMLGGEEQSGQRITPTLMFTGEVCGKAEEATSFSASVFPHSKVGPILRYGQDEHPDDEGTIKHASFLLEGQEFAAMDSARGHNFGFNEAISFLVSCETQQEIDHYWDSLSAVPEAEQCGWLKDRYGLSWQVVPSAMDEMMRSGTKEQMARVTEAFLKMKKFDIADLRRAYEGSEATAGGAE